MLEVAMGGKEKRVRQAAQNLKCSAETADDDVDWNWGHVAEGLTD